MSLINGLKRHARTNCATFNTGTDSECLRDMTCVHFQAGGGRCSYFENCVLPSDESLMARYWNALGSTDANADYCESCREPFEKKSNRQKYCAKCRENVRRDKQREYSKKYNEKSRIEFSI